MGFAGVGRELRTRLWQMRLAAGYGGAARPTWGWILNHRSAQAPKGGPQFVGPYARRSAAWGNSSRTKLMMSS